MQYNFTVLEIVGHLYRFCGNNHMKFEDHAGEIKNAYEEITKMDESALMAWLVRVALSISDELKNARNSSLRYLISEAKILFVMSMQMQICHLIPYVQSLVYQIPIFLLFLRKKWAFHLLHI